MLSLAQKLGEVLRRGRVDLRAGGRRRIKLTARAMPRSLGGGESEKVRGFARGRGLYSLSTQRLIATGSVRALLQK